MATVIGLVLLALLVVASWSVAGALGNIVVVLARIAVVNEQFMRPVVEEPDDAPPTAPEQDAI